MSTVPPWPYDELSSLLPNDPWITEEPDIAMPTITIPVVTVPIVTEPTITFALTTPIISIPHSSYEQLTGSLASLPEPWITTESTTVFMPASVDGSTGSAQSSMSAGVMVGATVGAIALVALLVLAILFFRKRRRHKMIRIASPAEDGELGSEEGRVDSRDTSVEMGEANNRQNEFWTGVRPLGKRLDGPSIMPFSAGSDGPTSPTSVTSSLPERSLLSNAAPFAIPANFGHPASTHTPSDFSDLQLDPPPTYAPEESVRQTPAFSAALALYASQHRDVINESLEARLQAAGYLPTDDPGNLSPEEWQNDYGVTKLELRRIQDLYEQTRQNQT